MAKLSLHALPSRYALSEDDDVGLLENSETQYAEALALSPTDEHEDWVYSATAESAVGEGVGLDLDGEPGLIAQWSSENIKNIRVTLEGGDVAEHAIINVPEATDTVQFAVTVGDVVVLQSDEGLSAQDAETLDFNIDGVITVAGGDVVRLVLITGGKFEDASWIVEDGANFNLMPA